MLLSPTWIYEKKIFINELRNHNHEGVGRRSAFFDVDWFITKVVYLPSVILVNLW